MMDRSLEGRPSPSGYRMLDDFNLYNFRCYDEVHLQDLRRVNIIVGENGSGKTTLGEALFMAAAGGPSAAFWVRNTRSLTTPQQTVFWDRPFVESYWKDLFADFDQTREIKIRFTDSSLGIYRVRVFLDARAEAKTTLDLFSAAPLSTAPPLVFEKTKEPDGARVSVRVVTNNKGVPDVEGYATSIPLCITFPSTYRFSAQQCSQWFSDLAKTKRESEVMGALTDEFNDIADVSMLLDAGQPTLFASIKGVGNSRVPITLYSDGASKYLSILLAIASTPKGIILVDEIENGFYYTRFPSLWKTILRFCRRYDVQLFASTHSRECINGAEEAVSQSPDDFCVMRTERKIVNGRAKCSVRRFSGRDFRSSIEQKVDIR